MCVGIVSAWSEKKFLHNTKQNTLLFTILYMVLHFRGGEMILDLRFFKGLIIVNRNITNIFFVELLTYLWETVKLITIPRNEKKIEL